MVLLQPTLHVRHAGADYIVSGHVCALLRAHLLHDHEYDDMGTILTQEYHIFEDY